jgi:hypothetical protein
MGLVLLRDEVMGQREILSPVQAALLGAVQSDRVGERIDRSMLKRLLKMMDDLGLCVLSPPFARLSRLGVSLVGCGARHRRCQF